MTTLPCPPLTRHPYRSDGYLRFFGWNRTLNTFYAQVWKDADGDEDALLYVGTTASEIPTATKLNRLCADYGGVPPSIFHQLLWDRDGHPDNPAEVAVVTAGLS